MPITDAYTKSTLQSLNAARPIEAKKMFGGMGLYCEGTFFAVIDDDRLFFKVDDHNRSDYEKAGMDQWVPDPRTGQKMSYFQVPPKVIKDPSKLGEWIDAAVEVAMRKKKKK